MSRAPSAACHAVAGDFVAFMVAAAHGFERHRNAYGLAVAQNVQLDGGAGLLLSDFDLKLAGIAHFLAVEFGDYIADFQASFRGGRTVFDLADHGSFIVFTWKNLAFSGVTSLMPMPM